jgi:hypothetical protein
MNLNERIKVIDKKQFLFYHSMLNNILFIILDACLVYYQDDIECIDYTITDKSALRLLLITLIYTIYSFHLHIL